MTLIIAFICLSGFNYPWWTYIIVLIAWCWQTFWWKVGRGMLATNNELVSLGVALGNKMVNLESTFNSRIEETQRMLRNWIANRK